jgi:hypothetical protein
MGDERAFRSLFLCMVTNLTLVRYVDFDFSGTEKERRTYVNT